MKTTSFTTSFPLSKDNKNKVNPRGLSQLPLYGKLSALLLFLTIVCSGAIITLGSWSSTQYHNEVTQQLHRDLAGYIIDHHTPVINANGIVKESALKEIAMHTMMINPLVEVYLVDPQGTVLGHALDTDRVQLKTIDLAPIQTELSGEHKGPLYGDDPSSPQSERIFSVAPITENEQLLGYLYVVLSSFNEQNISDKLSGSYILKVTIGALLMLISAFLVSLLIGFRQITKPLKELTRQAWSFRNERIAGEAGSKEIEKDLPANELVALSESFDFMQQRIQSQFNAMQQSEELRRELVSNISHDLRTPLSSMQGYIETVLLKLESLNKDEQKQYLKTALKHSNRLSKLISELFELSKLEANTATVEKEPFSLAELVHDITSEYQLAASKKNIKLRIDHDGKNALVLGDVSLMERVFQNLLDNALIHTPNDGEIVVTLTTQDQTAHVQISDSGAGINQEEIPYIFDRYYRSNKTPVKNANSTGLGLAIVKRILELHFSKIEVLSPPDKGATFQFPLPLAVSAD